MKNWKCLCVQCLFAIVVMVYLSNCNFQNTKAEDLNISLSIDTSLVPKCTVQIEKLKLNNGIYYLQDKAYSGYIEIRYDSDQKASIGSYLNGKQHGISTSYFRKGGIKDIRSYKNGRAYGKHFGFWENGNKKFEFIYINDKREGDNKQWYVCGKPYAFLTFKDDKEEGMQKAWRENGKAYINYETKNGKRYGLQKSALCYTLRDEEIKTK